MFQSYQYLEYLGYNPKVNQRKWQYKIIDSDFEHKGIVVAASVDPPLGAGGVAVIDTYSQRDLPVAPNLIRAFLWCQKQYGYTLDQMVHDNKKFNPRWPEVEKDMQKYLLFS